MSSIAYSQAEVRFFVKRAANLQVLVDPADLGQSTPPD
jgi:hypothetical protein